MCACTSLFAAKCNELSTLVKVALKMLVYLSGFGMRWTSFSFPPILWFLLVVVVVVFNLFSFLTLNIDWKQRDNVYVLFKAGFKNKNDLNFGHIVCDVCDGKTIVNF